MSIVLTRQQEALIRSRVAAGLYESATSMIDRALAVLEEREDRLARQRAFFDRELKPALNALDRGEASEWNMNAFVAEANRRLDARGVEL